MAGLYRRRSPVVGCAGVAATDQAVATAAALSILSRGGTAVDAAVAADAVLGVVQPLSTGVGGDAVALVASGEGVECYLGGGAVADTLDPTALIALGRLDPADARLVVVPGVVDAWISLLERFGRLDLGSVLAPAIRVAAGVPIGPVAARAWARFDAGRNLLGPPPAPLGRFSNSALAAFLRRLAEMGRPAFYSGAVAAAVARCAAAAGGSLTEADLSDHRGEWAAPVRRSVWGHELVEPPPPHGGVVALLAALLAEQRGNDPGTMVAAVDQAFEAAYAVVGDPRRTPVDVESLLATPWRDAASVAPREVRAGGTTMVMVGDADGMMVALGSSLFQGFGSGIVVPELGVCLNDRGYGFTPIDGHPNAPAPGVRPYHTVMPALLLTDAGAPRAAFGFAGADMQPQAQLQLLSHMLRNGRDPQDALDAPRWHSEGGGRVGVEGHVDSGVGAALASSGFTVQSADESTFGRGQVVVADGGGWYIGASDGRGDGLAAGAL